MGAVSLFSLLSTTEMDLDYRLNKFDKEKENRKKLAKERQSRELKQQKLQEEREQALALLAEQKRIQQEEIKQQQELYEIEENRRTGGIRIQSTLQAIPIALENDKVKLPSSLLNDLHNQGAFSCGRPVMFEIQPQDYSFCPTRLTHCGVLEFTANEGTIEIPTKVYRNLFQISNDKTSSFDISSLPPPIVSLKYVALPKITSVQFQPKLNLFSQIGPIKLILEENLQQHATLTLGDVLTVWYRGQSHDLIVTDLDPKDESLHYGGTVIDTNIEVNLDYSEEYLRSQPSQNLPRPISPLSSHQVSQLPSAPSLLATKPSRELPPEPIPSTDQFLVTFKFLFPSGGKAVRRFLLSSPIDEIFLYLRHLNAEGKLIIEANKFLQISTRQSPIRSYREQDDCQTLEQSIEHSGLVTLPSAGGGNLSEVLAVSYVS